jgi:hypothetical protein
MDKPAGVAENVPPVVPVMLAVADVMLLQKVDAE